MKNKIDISDNTAISMPVRNMLAIIGAVAVGVWAYFGVLERITMLETKSVLTEKEKNATKKSEINSECPSIANPSYIPY